MMPSEFHQNERMENSLMSGNAMRNFYTRMDTGLGGVIRSPYFPGTGLHNDTRFAPRRTSPYFPGSGPMDPADQSTYQIADAPTTLGWGTTFDAERTTQDEYQNENTGTFMTSTTQIQVRHNKLQ